MEHNTPTSQVQSRNIPMQLFKELTDYYQERISTLVYMLYKRGVTQTEIAKTLGVTKQAVSQQYPKGDIK